MNYNTTVWSGEGTIYSYNPTWNKSSYDTAADKFTVVKLYWTSELERGRVHLVISQVR